MNKKKYVRATINGKEYIGRVIKEEFAQIYVLFCVDSGKKGLYKWIDKHNAFYTEEKPEPVYYMKNKDEYIGFNKADKYFFVTKEKGYAYTCSLKLVFNEIMKMYPNFKLHTID